MNKIKLALIEIMSFNWLLYIKWETLLITFIFFPPSIFIWYYKVSRLAEQRLRKKPNFIFIIACIFYFFGLLFLILENSEGNFRYGVYLLYISALYCYYYLAKITLQVEDGDDKLHSIGQTVGRFILLSLVYIGPLVLQSNINKMFLDDVTE